MTKGTVEGISQSIAQCASRRSPDARTYRGSVTHSGKIAYAALLYSQVDRAATAARLLLIISAMPVKVVVACGSADMKSSLA